MNPIVRRFALLLLALLTCAPNALADGKMFVREKVPTTIPYQRAIILHSEGTQTLVLQSQYQVPKSSDTHTLGWVVPVPAVPQITSTSSDSASSAFMWMDMTTKPTVTRFSDIGNLISLCLPIATSVFWLFCGVFKRHGIRKIWFFRSGLSILVFFLVAVTVALITPAWKAGDRGVETLKSQQTGTYEIKVIRAKTAADVLAWLNENSFRFGPHDEAAVQAYLDKGWVFTVAKVRMSEKPPSVIHLSNGLADPLILRFPSANPIYPLALTATGGHDTEVLIYLASDIPRTCDGRLSLRFGGSARDGVSRSLHFIMPDNLNMCENQDFWTNDELSGRYHFTRLAKFKGTLTPEQMRKDLEFLPDPNQTDYREHIYRW